MGAGLYSHTTRASGLTLTANIYNTDHQNHINNHNTTQIDDYSSSIAEMKTMTDPYASDAVNRTIGSVTVGGNTCTSITTVYANPGDGFGSGIFAVQLEAGTTGDVVVTLSDALGANRALGVSVFRMVGRAAVTANATNTDTATSTGALTLSLNTIAG
jgi:hypothetical protein